MAVAVSNEHSFFSLIVTYSENFLIVAEKISIFDFKKIK